MFRHWEGQERQALETRDLVEKMAKSTEWGKMEREELTRKLIITEERMECLEACMKNLPSTPEKQYLTETQAYGGRFTQSIINQEIVTIKQSLGNMTSTVVHLKATVDSIRDPPMNEMTLEARIIAMENDVRNLMDTMEGITQ